MLSLQTSVCSTLKFHPVFSGVIMSIRSFFLFCLKSDIPRMQSSSKYTSQDLNTLLLTCGESIIESEHGGYECVKSSSDQ